MGRPERVTRERVLAEARRAFAERGFDGTTLADIAGRVAVSSADDPARVLRRLAREFIPFIEQKMGENIARFLRARSEEEARTNRLPFDPRKKSAPPARAIRALESYLRRAREAGAVSVKSARAAALAFLGSLQSYVFLHRVLRIEPPIPLEGYLDTVLEIWKHGAIRGPKRGSR